MLRSARRFKEAAGREPSSLVHYLSADQCIANFPGHLEPEERRVLSLTPKRGRRHQPVQIGIEYADIGIRAGSQMARVKAEHARRRSGDTVKRGEKRQLFFLRPF